MPAAGMAHQWPPPCASRTDLEWGVLLVDVGENGGRLQVIRLYGGAVWNAAGPFMRIRHIPRGRPGSTQRGMLEQVTNTVVYCNGEPIGGPSCQAIVGDGATLSFEAGFNGRATLVSHVVEIDPVRLRRSLTKRRPRDRTSPPITSASLAPPVRAPRTGFRLVLRALVATSDACACWAIVAVEQWRFVHGDLVRVGLVAVKGCWPVSGVGQMGDGTVAFVHGLRTPPADAPQRTRGLPLLVFDEGAVTLSHGEGRGLAAPLTRHAQPLGRWAEPTAPAAPRSAKQAAKEARAELAACQGQLDALHSAPPPVSWGAVLGMATEASIRERSLAQHVGLARRVAAAERRLGELAADIAAEDERDAVNASRRAADKRADAAKQQAGRLVGRHPPRHIMRGVGACEALWAKRVRRPE